MTTSSTIGWTYENNMDNLSSSRFVGFSVCEKWRTSSRLVPQVHLAHHKSHAGQTYLWHPGGKLRLPSLIFSHESSPVHLYNSSSYLFISSSSCRPSKQLPLELTQSFVKNVDGSYSPFRCPEPPPEPELPEGYRTDRPQAIRPMELRTFLKVGEWLSEKLSALL